MSWKTEFAVKRIFNSFKRLKNQIFTQDIEALKLINETLAESEKQYINDNLLYAKLLCYVLDRNLHYHGDIKTAIKNAADILKEPLDFHLQMLHKNINDKNILKHIDDIDFENTDQKELIKKLENSFSYESVEKSFFNTANDFLRETDNYI